MRRIAIALFVTSVLAATSLDAQGTKWVRGKVTAMAGDTITVQVRGKDMPFAVGADTEVVAEGAGTRAAQAQREGMPGPKLAEVVKLGDGVEVHYREAAGAMRATEIRAGVSVGGGATSEDSGSSVRGTITSVSASSLAIKATSGDMTFTVDAKTTVIGRGVGTRAAEMKKAGKEPAITDLLGVGDTVVVSFHPMGATMHAGEVRLARRAAP